ncbi:MAG TPA: RDD family protein [Candidatus Acidoferrales bacterium]|nr:RDD family protein [Candidatus Acidoferrales bacterium]
MDDNQYCSFCEVSPAEIENEEVLQAVASGEVSMDGTDEPEWRREVSRRLEQYRTRHGRPRPDESQSGLPFREDRRPGRVRDVDLPIERAAEAAPAEPPPERKRVRPSVRQRAPERVEICIQPELDFADGPGDRARPQTALVPVATPTERGWAGVVDILFLGLTLGGFLGLFRSLGGQIVVDKMDAVVYLIVGFLFYALYFSLFTSLAGATPGMQLRGLTIVRLDGSLPDTRQLVWRSFGYVLSGATLMLGFVWALWDEDRFTWQDRISQTYVTAAVPISGLDSIEMAAARQTFAHK